MCLILGDRAFDINDYARELFYAAFCLAHMESNIFVGRGIHLMLPRDRVFAVRIVSSRERRIKRLADSLNIDGFVKSPNSLLRFILRFFMVR
ncbi:MAG: hypothetical protein PF482_17950 [Desulfobacteraceae bacterium]|jgi:hypothetical protein|nr:hypothetical protein [Desulfobacteraceae bacterium]